MTSANVHDSNIFEELLDPSNTSKDVWADSAYRSQDAMENLQANGYREHLQRKGTRNRKLSNWEQQGNRTRSRIRSGTKIGLRNLALNLDRNGTLCISHG